MQASIVVPNLDCPLVDRTLKALREQSLDSAAYEILVVGRDAPGLVPRDGSVRFIDTVESLSPAAARNIGVESAQSTNLFFTDADCIPAMDWLQRLQLALETYPVAGGSVRFALSGNRWAVADNIASFNELLNDRPAGPAADHPLGTLNLALRRDAWSRVGPFDEELVTSEDFDWVLRANAKDVATYFEPEAVVEHGAARHDREALEAHATWYGRHFNSFRRKHPGVFDAGPSWQSRSRLARTYRLKAWISAMQIYLRHSSLLPAWRALPGVVAFKRAWYRAVLESWQEP